jgi:hypothetical protein
LEELAFAREFAVKNSQILAIFELGKVNAGALLRVQGRHLL